MHPKNNKENTHIHEYMAMGCLNITSGIWKFIIPSSLAMGSSSHKTPISISAWYNLRGRKEKKGNGKFEDAEEKCSENL